VPWHHFTLTPINLLMFPQVQSQLWLDCGWMVGNTDISTRLPETSVLPVIGQNPISGSVSVLAIWRQGKKTSS
jgi:hypothetical protein